MWRASSSASCPGRWLPRTRWLGRSAAAAMRTPITLEQGLLHSDKDQAEHRVVVEAVAEALGPVCDELDVPGEPSMVGCATFRTSAAKDSGPAGGRQRRRWRR